MSRIILLFLVFSVLLGIVYGQSDFDDLDGVILEEEEEEQVKMIPILLVHKDMETEVVVNKNITVTTTLYNIGESEAYDIIVEDLNWEDHENVELLEGGMITTFPRLEAKGSEVFTTIIRAKEIKPFEVIPAVIKYKIREEDKEYQIARSTDLPRIQVMSQRKYDKKHDKHIVEWIIFGILCFLSVGVPGLLHLYGRVNIQKLKKKRK